MPFARLVLTAILGPPILVAVTLCAMAATAAQFGRRSPSLDLLTHLAPLYLLGGLVALAAALVFHDRYRLLVAIAGLICVAGAAALMGPEYLRSAGPKLLGNGPTLKIVQLNIWEGKGGVHRAAAWLANQHPDVVIVEEANRQVRATLAGLTGWHVTRGRSSVLIFTRDPPIAALSPTDDETGPAGLMGVTLRTAAGDVAILGVRYPWPNDPNARAAAANLIPIVRSFPAETTILAGDFNSTPWSFTRRREDRAFGLIRRTRGLFSWPAGRYLPFPVLPIDHVYAGAGWATVKVERGPNLGSDHYPVVVTLARVAGP